MEKVAVFIDWENIDQARRDLDHPHARFNYRALLEHIATPRTRKIVTCNAYAPFSPEQGQRLRYWLKRYGIEVTYVQSKQSRVIQYPEVPLEVIGITAPDGGDVRVKSSEFIKFQPKYHEHTAVAMKMVQSSLEFVAHAFQIGAQLDTVVFVTGNAHLIIVVDALRRLGIRVEIYGPASATAEVLKEAANMYVPLSADKPQGAAYYDRFFFIEDRDKCHPNRTNADKEAADDGRYF